MNILITGASGMLGTTLVQQLKTDYNVFATGNSTFNEQHDQYLIFDLSKSSYKELIDWSNPDLIIHCGALTNGNLCNENPELALNVNGLSIQKLIQSTNPSVKIIYISTDAVFPSDTHLAREVDCVKPENVYGKSKELGEFFLLNSNREYLIIRTTIVGFNINSMKSSFVEWIINASIKQEKIGLFNDVNFTPISIYDFAKELNFLITGKHINSKILHIGGSEICTKYEFGIKLLEELKLITNNIEASSILNFKDRVKRCTDQTLSSNFYQEKYKRKLPSLTSTIQSLKDNYNEYN